MKVSQHFIGPGGRRKTIENEIGILQSQVHRLEVERKQLRGGQEALIQAVAALIEICSDTQTAAVRDKLSAVLPRITNEGKPDLKEVSRGHILNEILKQLGCP